ncbi:hypothetical protein D9613_001718 [Agrocybe pediades]|uniref:Small ribosomal subunit protein mS35 mitochondrial conserved domain-containing protein n=1 Tax=Agrocybe pediades TaxID=84607 RepID=A0A8H4R870_9AGAR|nr:hypothetical protein D9613_001718 [Agrocybe pediades]KAF9568485.1 hypothetical protein CPC08DRAFT_654763 [Agrocybe pediades]
MASSLSRCLSIARTIPLRTPRVTQNVALKNHFSSSSAVFARQKRNTEVAPTSGKRRNVSVLEEDLEDAWDTIDLEDEIEDAPSLDHIILEQQRQMLHYMRLIEHEMPKLVAYRKDFIPPTPDTPLIVRSVHYQGEAHPVSLKRVIVAPVDQLPLKDDAAKHKFILLAGPRWSPVPHADAGVGGTEIWGNGYVKISCEDFPKASQNLKWASDTLDKMIEEANNGADSFADVPVDLRHLMSKVRKAKKGDHRGYRAFNRTTLRDFPQEWLPPTAQHNA